MAFIFVGGARGQVSVEFLVVMVGVLAVYSVVFPTILSSFQNSHAEFNTAIAREISNQVVYNAEVVKLLEPGALLESEFNSPVEFNLEIQGGQLVSSMNHSVALTGAYGVVQIKKGRTALQFLRTSSGVEIYSK